MPEVIKGQQAICEAIGYCKHEFYELIRDGLPAWQEKNGGTWRAIPEQLQEWLRDRSRQFRQPCQ